MSGFEVQYIRWGRGRKTHVSIEWGLPGPPLDVLDLATHRTLIDWYSIRDWGREPICGIRRTDSEPHYLSRPMREWCVICSNALEQAEWMDRMAPRVGEFEQLVRARARTFWEALGKELDERGLADFAGRAYQYVI